jgi:hypothetical protein
MPPQIPHHAEILGGNTRCELAFSFRTAPKSKTYLSHMPRSHPRENLKQDLKTAGLKCWRKRKEIVPAKREKTAHRILHSNLKQCPRKLLCTPAEYPAMKPVFG